MAQSNNEDGIQEDKVLEQPFKKQKALTSKVWKEFSRIEQFEKKEINGNEMVVKTFRAICNYCKANFDGNSKKGTTHLDNHLKRCPKKKMHSVDQQLIQATARIEDGKCVLSNYQFDNAKSQRLLAEAIMLHCYPFNMVTHQGFLDYVKSLRPSHHVPSRTTIAKLCIEVYNDYKQQLYDLFANSSFKVSLTMDKWTSSSQNKSYLCITAHFVDDGWVLQKRIIGFINVHGSTGIDICNVLMSRMLDWNIDGKIFTVTVDNDKANDVALKNVKNRLSNSLLCGGAFFHVRCAAHIINLIVQDGLKKIAKSIENVRLSVKYITCSPQIEGSFYEIAKQSGVASQKSLSLDCVTRWNSTYLMLKNAIHYKHALRRFQLKDVRYTHCPSDNEWKHVETLCECLKHFFVVTELLSGTKYPTSNLFYVHFCEIYLLLIEWATSQDEVIVSMSLAMKIKFDKYWMLVNKVLAVASFVDPRSKTFGFTIYNKEIYGETEGLMHSNEMIDIIKRVYSDYASKVQSNTSVCASSIASQSQVVDKGDVASYERKSRFARYMEKLEENPTKSDLDLYMEEPVLKWQDKTNETFDVLAWWKVNVGKYPILASMARDVLGIPISTVASESAFSTSGRVIDDYRSSLTIDMVEILMCGQDWIKASKGAREVHSLVDDICARSVSSIPQLPTNDYIGTSNVQIAYVEKEDCMNEYGLLDDHVNLSSIESWP